MPADCHSLWSHTALHPVDSVDSIQSNDNDNDSVFVVGCYEYVETERRRRGALYRGTAKHYWDGETRFTDVTLYPADTLDFGVLDVRLRRTVDGCYALIAIGSDASLHVMRLPIEQRDPDDAEIKRIVTLSHLASPTDVIGLSLDAWAAGEM